MRKIIAIFGEPASGKTTLMWEFINNLGYPKTFIFEEPVRLLTTVYNKEHNIHVLGKYSRSEPFSGTDRLSMAVQPEAVKFIKKTKSNIVFEGDRLTNISFFEFLTELPDTEVKLIYLVTTPQLLEKRHKERGDDQSAQFLGGRETKVERLQTNFMLMDYIERFKNENLQDQKNILSFINEQLGIE